MIVDILYSVALAALYVFITSINTLVIVWIFNLLISMIRKIKSKAYELYRLHR